MRVFRSSISLNVTNMPLSGHLMVSRYSCHQPMVFAQHCLLIQGNLGSLLQVMCRRTTVATDPSLTLQMFLPQLHLQPRTPLFQHQQQHLNRRHYIRLAWPPHQRNHLYPCRRLLILLIGQLLQLGLIAHHQSQHSHQRNRPLLPAPAFKPIQPQRWAMFP